MYFRSFERYSTRKITREQEDRSERVYCTQKKVTAREREGRERLFRPSVPFSVVRTAESEGHTFRRLYRINCSDISYTGGYIASAANTSVNVHEY